ncbi:hypothetical protein C5167_034172 [Papaver somniferum]|uniref:Uncharacterized protein n=1 Tax=Papaver somniferum TaxID=3469 RepID=A0A4Y7KF42_PAPSO|nr:uncharacterized protein LOC113293199 [Papaver somniferum]XP_026397698.1 uncharacterized protein LOC113293199 [Papaver somniferum]RZC70982.1 hypothetical protein C5167_034172 [Papaver somniferum]
MDYRNVSDGYKSSCTNLPPPNSTSTYFTEQASSMGYDIPRADFMNLREAIEIELEKERIRQETIEAEIIRRKVIEAELERQKIRESTIRRAQYRAPLLRQHHHASLDDFRLQERFSFSSHPEDGGFDRLPIRGRNH